MYKTLLITSSYEFNNMIPGFISTTKTLKTRKKSLRACQVALTWTKRDIKENNNHGKRVFTILHRIFMLLSCKCHFLPSALPVAHFYAVKCGRRTLLTLFCLLCSFFLSFLSQPNTFDHGACGHHWMVKIFQIIFRVYLMLRVNKQNF